MPIQDLLIVARLDILGLFLSLTMSELKKFISYPSREMQDVCMSLLWCLPIYICPASVALWTNTHLCALSLLRSVRGPAGRRHERLTTQHGGLWYHLWVRRRRGWARSKRGTLAQILSGACGHARGRAHHSVSGAVFVAAVCACVALLCFSLLSWC